MLKGDCTVELMMEGGFCLLLISAHLPILTQALQAGHLNHVKELDIWECNYQPSHLRPLLEAFKISKGKLEAVTFEVPDDLTTRRAMHELLSSPVCSELRKLEMTPNVDTDVHKSAIRFVTHCVPSERGPGRLAVLARIGLGMD